MSDREVQVLGEGWITTSDAVDETGYGAEYLRQLARAGKLDAQQLAGRWLFNRDALLAYKARMDALGRRKHDPHGIAHAEAGDE